MTEPKDFIKMGDKYLEHFGKIGMRWGHRSGQKTPLTRTQKPTNSQIHDARANVKARQDKIFRADQDLRTATTKKGKSAALKVIKDQISANTKSGDSRIAARTTRGEKVISGLIYGASGLILVSMIANQ